MFQTDPALSPFSQNSTLIFTILFQVMCTGHFAQNIPIEELRKDVNILTIEPSNPCSNDAGDGSSSTFCGTENELTMGPIFQVATPMTIFCFI
jgi:hypothetical protein